ncbi:hypothetical protein POVWA2_027110 [Plasmodium ovale wallikeri]|uniref:Uncharacterized protein n=1 Tax=Plasmodium ovale wallikeri TaxID=864142 RepID=A0A1A8YWL6_PLAOA|nr:hypothetical protein POVWA1_029100 [Plasmodium ovale wallikeri]SBT35851.1 hypothetical protein POVWA2_027110 [Plasmodium ovale wallikeri]
MYATVVAEELLVRVKPANFIENEASKWGIDMGHRNGASKWGIEMGATKITRARAGDITPIKPYFFFHEQPTGITFGFRFFAFSYYAHNTFRYMNDEYACAKRT